MSRIDSWYSFLNRSEGVKEEQIEISKLPIELEEKINLLDKPLIIECACPGWQLRSWPSPEGYPWGLPSNYQAGGIRYPAIPISFEDQANEIVMAAKAGCAASHVHPRDPATNKTINTPEMMANVYDKIFAAVDVISLQHTWHINQDGFINYVADAKDLLASAGGNRFCQGAVVLWPPGNSYPRGYTKSVQEAILFMEENKIKPIHKIRGGYHLRQLKRILIDTKIITKEPLVLIHDMGHPFGWPMDIDPWMPIDLIASLEQAKKRIPNSVIGVYSGGRNWMSITMTAILAGVDIVRVGIEDVYWMYPHKDEVIQKNIDCVNKIIDFCNLIGRRIATVDEARKILGIERTS